MFTQKLSMDCTREQYEKYLKDDLLKMGYPEKYIGEGTWDIIVNNYADKMGMVTNLEKSCYNDNDRTYLGSFSASLFLALAAMTDEKYGGYGEYWVFKGKDCAPEFISGNIYKAITPINKAWCFIDEMGYENSFSENEKYFRKATVSEIMQKFGENNEIKIQITPYGKMINNLMKDSTMAKEKDLRELLQSGRIVELRDGQTGIIIATHKGLLVQFEEKWNSLNNYHSNLKSTIKNANDIVRIREIKDEPQVLRQFLNDAPIIWERKEVKEYTLDEVLKMAGLDKAEVKVIQK